MAGEARDRAVKLLQHYIGLLMRRNGGQMDSDVYVELEELVDAIIEAAREPKPRVAHRHRRPPTQQTPPTPGRPAWFIKISHPEGGYVNGEGYATLDKAQAYRWQSHDGAVQYIVDNINRLGHMTLEEAPV